MNVLITGATGLIGTAIIHLCEQRGYTVHYLTTNKSKIKNKNTVKGFYWNPKTQEVDVNCLDGIDAVINLAGASIAKRWTATYKKEILDSRIQSTELLHKLLLENKHQVKTVVSASAIGIYPSSQSNVYDETSTLINDSFLGKVVSAWEAEITKLNNLNLSVCNLRIGIVFSKNGGALEKMAQPIQAGFGASLGHGKQHQSWIHETDLAHLFLFITEHGLNGVYNAVSSDPVTNRVMTKAIAKQLKKPLWLPNAPAFILKIILGEMATLVLESQKVSNAKILKKGFVFKYNSLEKALDDCFEG